ncbi:MAG: DegV family protein [Bacilli bacterium]|jgi:DegV family protein with EDD domain
MNEVQIVVDSTVDLSPEMVKENNLIVLPLHVAFKDDVRDYKDGIDIKAEELYNKVEKNGGFTPKTGAVNVAEFVKAFKPIIDSGKDIIFTGIGAKLSSTYQNAVLASKEFPEGRIKVLDSGSLSTGTGLLVMKMVKFKNEGKSVSEIYDEVSKLVPLVSTKFCIDTLTYLFKGGRCSGMTMIVAHALHIHPVAKMIDGKLVVYKKPRGGYEKAMDAQIEEFMEDLPNIDKDCLFITHSGRIDGCDKYIFDKISKFYPKENIHITEAGCTVCSHCGPKTIGILYILTKPRAN